MDPLPTIQLLAAAMVVLLFVQGLVLVVAVRILSRLAGQVESTLEKTQQDVAAALHQSRVTLERVERLARAYDGLAEEHVAPTLEATRSLLGEVEQTARSVRSGVDGLQGAVHNVASASGSGVLALLGRTVYKRSGKLGLVVLGLSAALRALTAPRQKARPTTRRNIDAGR